MLGASDKNRVVEISLDACNTHSNDYLENLKLAVRYGKRRTRLLSQTSPVLMQAPTGEQSIEGATLVAARGLRRNDVGRIEAGAKADLASIDVTAFLVGGGQLPPEPLNNLLYANGKMVRHVVTDGMFQVFDGQMVIADEAEVVRRGGEVVTRIWGRLEDEGCFAPADPTRRAARKHLPR